MLVVILADDFLLLKELDRVPNTHGTSGQQAGDQQQDRCGSYGARRTLPAAGQTRPEGTEDGHKANDEERNAGAGQMQPGRGILIRYLIILHLREVVNVRAVRLNGGQISGH